MIFVGNDWAEDHHDIHIMNEQGKKLASRRLPEGVEGVGRLHALSADHAKEPGEVVVGIETDRGLWVNALAAAGYRVHAVNPLSVARYRERHHVGGGKSDPGDAVVLADMVRTDADKHRTIAGDSDQAESIKVLARAHQNLIWSRARETNRLRNGLREYYPAALVAFEDLDDRDALAVLAKAPHPALAAKLTISQLTATLRTAGRKRYLKETAARIQDGLRTPQMSAPAAVAQAHAATTSALVALISSFNTQIAALEDQLGSTVWAAPGRRDHQLASRPSRGPRRPGTRRVRGRPRTLR